MKVGKGDRGLVAMQRSLFQKMSHEVVHDRLLLFGAPCRGTRYTDTSPHLEFVDQEAAPGGSKNMLVLDGSASILLDQATETPLGRLRSLPTRAVSMEKSILTAGTARTLARTIFVWGA